MMIVRLLMALGGVIYLTLGTLHLYYTFFTPKFKPFDASVEEGMKHTTPRLTKRTTLWKAWMGFNGSHSSGAMFFGFFLLYFSFFNSSVFEQSAILQSAALLNSAFYLYLAKTYWFRIPLTGIFLATVSLTIGIVLIHLL